MAREVCAVIDLDGFTKGKEFFCRELGFSAITFPYNQSVRFDLTEVAGEMSPTDWRSARFCKKFVHGLTVTPMPNEETFPVQDLDKFLRVLHFDTSTNEKKVIAYKGGHLERDILAKLNIPSLNLETLGCPKFEDLVKTYSLPNDCGYHWERRNFHPHCPKVETFVFANWMMESLAFSR